MIEADQFVHHPLTDQLTGHFPLAEFLHVPFDPVNELIECSSADRSLLAGLLDRSQQFLALVVFAPLIAFDNFWKHFFDALSRGETLSTLEAFPTPTNFTAVSP
jgi:hypothetical protein